MPTNYQEWERELRAASEELVATQILRLQKNLAFLTIGAAVEITPGNVKRILGVVLRTPVMTGLARASWNVSTGAMDLSHPTEGKQKYKALTHTQAASALKNLGLYDIVWVANGLPYISVLEYGGYPDPPTIGTWNPKLQAFEFRSANSFSKQAPGGMVRITIDEVSDLLA